MRMGAGVSDGWTWRAVGLMASFAVLGSASGAATLEKAGHLGGPCQAVELGNEWAYLGVGSTLVVFDAQPAGAAEIRATLQLPGVVEDIARTDALLYVTASPNWLCIVDISTPVLPKVLAEFETARGPVRRLAVTGGIAYVAAGTRLEIIDVSDSAAPQGIGAFECGGTAQHVTVIGGLAYVAHAAGGEAALSILDVSTPANPTRVGSFNWGGYADAVAVSGTYAYFATDYAGIQVLDVANPASITRVTTYTTQGVARNIRFEGTRAYVCNESGGVEILDVADLAAPRQLAVYNTPGKAVDVAVSGAFVYVADNDVGLTVVDFTNLAGPQAVAEYSALSVPDTVAVDGELVFVADVGGSLVAYDVSDPAKPVSVDRLTNEHLLAGLAAANGRLAAAYTYTSSTDSSRRTVLEVFNSSTPANGLARMGSLDIAGSAGALTMSGSYVYMAAGRDGLRIFDISNPASMDLLGTWDEPSTDLLVMAVAVVDDLAYVACGGGGLVILDVSVPEEPVRIGGLDTSGEAVGVTVVGDLAYVADRRDGVKIIDVSDPTAPELYGSYDTPSSAWSVAVAGQFAFVADTESVEVLDISDPSRPERLESYAVFGGTDAVVSEGDYAYAVDTGSGVAILTVVGDTVLPPIFGICGLGASQLVGVTLLGLVGLRHGLRRRRA